MTINYKDYLESDDWQDQRKRALHLANHKCQICGGRFILQAHHKTYERLGEEKDEDLIILCQQCHKAMHGESYLNCYVMCQTCGEPCVEISSPDPGWIRFTCFDGHVTERKL